MRSHYICLALILTGFCAAARADEPRSKAHAEYAVSLWNYVTNSVDYKKWQDAAPLEELSCAPPADSKAKSFLNAAAQTPSKPRGAVVVTEHYGEDGKVQAITVCVRARDGYHSINNDWYWAHYLPDGTTVKTSVDKSPYAKRGFVAFEEEGRLWVFTTNSDQLAGFLKQGELAKHVIRPGAGPHGMTIKAPDAETVDAYLTSKPGFVTKREDGRLWVFRAGSEELKQYEETGDPAKHVIRPGAGPGGLTVKSPDSETILAYLTACDGFATVVEDGRLWVFRLGSKELQDFTENGEPAKHVIRPAAGPAGLTVKGPNSETIDAYLRIATR